MMDVAHQIRKKPKKPAHQSPKASTPGYKCSGVLLPNNSFSNYSYNTHCLDLGLFISLSCEFEKI